MKGFITLQRKFLNWGWYDCHKTSRVFLHLLLTANWEDKYWKGTLIKRGQVIVGRIKLAKEVGLSQQNIRTCLNRLKSTNEITTKTTNEFTLVTIIKYNDFQDLENQSTNQLTNQPTNNQPTTNQQLTNDQPQLNHLTIKPLKPLNNVDEEGKFSHINFFKNNSLFLDDIKNDFNINDVRLREITKKFLKRIKTLKKQHKNEQDFREHFYNTVEIDLKIEKQKNFAKKGSQGQKEAPDFNYSEDFK